MSAWLLVLAMAPVGLVAAERVNGLSNPESERSNSATTGQLSRIEDGLLFATVEAQSGEVRSTLGSPPAGTVWTRNVAPPPRDAADGGYSEGDRDISALVTDGRSAYVPIELAFATSAIDQTLSQLRQASATLADGRFAVVWQEGGPLGGCGPSTRFCEVRMQWVDQDGMPRFASGGLPVGSTADNELDPVVVAAPSGGVFVAFRRDPGKQVFVQSFDAAGDRRWAEGGVLAVDPLSGSQSQNSPYLVAGSAGGVFVCFSTLNPSGIRCQFLDEAGVRGWPDAGVVAAEGPEWRVLPRGVSDSAGGLLIFWRNQRNIFDDELDPMLMEGQHFASDGSRLWGQQPLVIRTTNLVDTNHHAFTFFEAVSDGDGGAIVAFNDWTTAPDPHLDVLAQRVNGTGQLLWTDGTVVVAEEGQQQHSTTVGDGLGGAFVVAQHLSDATGTRSNLRVYHLGPEGGARWTSTGLPLSDPEDSALNYLSHGSFDRGILRLGWTHQVSPSSTLMDVQLARFTIDGRRLDGAGGLALTTAVDAQFLHGLSFSPTTNRLLAVWDDRRKATWDDLDVYGALLEGDPYALLDITKEGGGTVRSVPAGISCGGDCQETYSEGTTVTLRATPFFGSEFAGWGGGSDCVDGIVAMTTDWSCTATFSPCSIPSGVTVSNIEIAGAETHQACNALIVGPSVTISGQAVFRAGNSVRFVEPVTVAAGATMDVVNGPPIP